MKNTKKTFALFVILALAVSLFTGCGSTSGTSQAAAPATAEPAAAASTEALAEPIVVKLGVTSGDKDMWAYAKETLLAEKNIDIQFVEFTDYVTPNNALANGDIDLNSFQHVVYLNGEIAEKGYEIEPIGYTVISPLNLYSYKVKSVDEIKDGDIIAVPNDTTNEGRALKVLQNAGLITLGAEDTGSPTLDDIAQYNVAIEIKELQADTITAALPDVTAAIVNANYATDFGLNFDETVIFYDEGTGSEGYWNVIAARSADLQDPEKVALYREIVDAFHTDGTKEILHTVLHDSSVAAGWDVDLLSGAAG